MRLTKSIIRDLMIYLIGFGLSIGLVFPFFTLSFGVKESIAMSPQFFMACIGAGALVGTVNIIIIKKILIKRLQEMTEKMNLIKGNVINVAKGEAGKKCDLETCQINLGSIDEIGDGITAYNQLVETLSLTMSSEVLMRYLDQKHIAEKVLPQLINETKSIAGAIFIECEGDMKLINDFSLKRASELCTNEVILSVANTAKKIHLKLPEDIIIDGIIADIRPKEALVEPILFNDVVIGVVLLTTVYKYTNKEFEKIGILMKNLALALHNADMHEKAQRLAAIDPLTNVYNRRFGMTRLNEEYSRFTRTNIPIGAMMLDLDYFKLVNDNYGHLAGDKVLVTVAKLIRNTIRDGDIVMRYGGEEFFIILPGASIESTYNVAEKIRKIIEKQIIIYGDSEIKVTVSIGITSTSENIYKDETEIIAAVDKALYSSKQNGRNQITIANQK